MPIVWQALRLVNSIYHLIHSPINNPHDVGDIASFLTDKDLGSELWCELFKVTQLVSDRVGTETETCWHQYKYWSTMLPCRGLWDWEDGISKRTGPRIKARIPYLGSISQGRCLLFSLLFYLHAKTRHLALSPFGEIPSILYTTTLSLFIPKLHYGHAHPLPQNHSRHVQLLDPV